MLLIAFDLLKFWRPDVHDEFRRLFLGCGRRDGGWQSRIRIQTHSSCVHGSVLFRTSLQGSGVQGSSLFTTSIFTSSIQSSCIFTSCLQSTSLHGPSSYVLQKIILLESIDNRNVNLNPILWRNTNMIRTFKVDIIRPCDSLYWLHNWAQLGNKFKEFKRKPTGRHPSAIINGLVAYNKPARVIKECNWPSAATKPQHQTTSHFIPLCYWGHKCCLYDHIIRVSPR